MGSVAVSYGSNHAGTVFSLIRRIGAVLFAQQGICRRVAFQAIHTGRKAAAVLTMSFQGDLQNSLS